MAGRGAVIASNSYRIVAVGAAGAVALVALVYYGQPTRAAPESVALPVGEAVAVMTIHVSGEVLSPGLVEVTAPARVADVIAAAGGSTANADLAAVNLAASVRDGEQVAIPRVGGASAPPGDGRVRLNTAAATELEQIPGVGPVLAARIIAARDSRGGFDSVEDLLDVAGIGEAKLAAMRDVVVVP